MAEISFTPNGSDQPTFRAEIDESQVMQFAETVQRAFLTRNAWLHQIVHPEPPSPSRRVIECTYGFTVVNLNRWLAPVVDGRLNATELAGLGPQLPMLRDVKQPIFHFGIRYLTSFMNRRIAWEDYKKRFPNERWPAATEWRAPEIKDISS
jgi:hypothetical protein